MSTIPQPGPFDLDAAKSTQGNTKYFTGWVMISDLMLTKTQGGAESLNYKFVSFDTKARTNWHTHAFAQDLFIVSGECWAQIKDGPVVKAKTGSMLHFPAGILHWHGASATGPMVHLAVNGPGATDWKEPVSDAEYMKG